MANRRMGRRASVRLISYTVALIVVLLVTAVSSYLLANRNRRIIEYSYQRALGELSEYIGNIDITLDKGKYAVSEKQLAGLSSKLWRDTGFAKGILEQLPVRGEELNNTYRFLSQAGNFCVSLSQRVSKGETLTEEDVQILRQLSGYARKLSGQLAAMQSQLEAGELELGEVAAVMDGETNTTETPDLNSGFLEMEQELEDYPTLIYDGPFSDHIQQQEPKFLADKPVIAAGEAIIQAVRFAGTNDLAPAGEVGGHLPSYQFVGEKITACVSKAGGQIVSFTNARPIGEAGLSVEQALKRGEEFLSSHDLTGFVDRYYSMNNGVLTINYAYAEDNVVYYPDLIKVGIAMDNGEMVLYDAKGYLMNHTTRNFSEPKLGEKEARARLSPYLTVEGEGRLALIPSEGLGEALCYEFTCTGEGGDRVLVYIHTETGMEEQILVLLEDDTGVLVM